MSQPPRLNPVRFEVKKWLDKVNSFFTANVITRNRCDIFTSLLDDECRQAVEADDYDNDDTTAFEQMKDALEMTYRSMTSRTNAHRHFVDRMQWPDESVKVFAQALKHLARKLYTAEELRTTAEQILIDKFIDGIANPHLQLTLMRPVARPAQIDPQSV